ncbi:hypothetical protein M407DRAFT_18061 [Tulasnella calospora MUT 4182]|uniref:Uncharacterized protein n=1 Tax=Tulasnella calospora MUT 4182 TaxID=1051891 RepID=A0A0C3LGW2_9AGAM|nr:hypothetical protein M407DRAFT_18061 [Tulasnella calospora MUT 4182]
MRDSVAAAAQAESEISSTPESAVSTLGADRSEPVSTYRNGPGVQTGEICRTAGVERSETDFEFMEQTLKGILKRIKGSAKADLRDIADIAIISDYNVLVHHLRQEGHSSPKMEASMRIAQSKLTGTSHEGHPIAKGKWFARQLRKKAEHIRMTGSLPERKQGKGGTHYSLLDEGVVQKAVKSFFTSTKIGEINPRKLMKHMNEKVLPSLPHKKKRISESTAKLWMRKHGY